MSVSLLIGEMRQLEKQLAKEGGISSRMGGLHMKICMKAGSNENQ